MIMGARSAEAQLPDSGIETFAQDNLPEAEGLVEFAAPAAESDAPAERRALGFVLIVLAAAWIGLAGWWAARRAAPTLDEAVLLIAVVSGPLVLLGLVWLLFGRTPRREAERFRTIVGKVSRESASLENLLSIVAMRLEENHARLTNETAKLMKLGDEAQDRLGRVTHYVAKETAALDRKAEQLESAANAARVDIGVLLSDLPRAEEQARAVAEAMKQAGLAALGEAGQLESQLSALVARGREADEVVGGTAQRLAAHLARIESSTAAAKTQLDDAAVSMAQAVDTTMARTADAIDVARASLDAQGQAMLAMIEQSRAALEEAGESSGRSLAARLEQVSGQIGALAAQLAAQDAASQGLTDRLSNDLAELDGRFAALGQAGQASNAQLSESVQAVRARVQELQSEVAGGQERAAGLIERAREMAEALTGITRHLQGELPAALVAVEEQAGRTRGAAEALAPLVEAVQVAACDAAGQAAAAEASIVRQRDALDGLLATLRANVAEAETQLRALEEAAQGADAAAGRIVADTGPELIEALVRVREASAQAAERARETIAAVIPEAAGRLGEASRGAVRSAVAETVEGQVQELTALSERAAETARAASERLTRQMLAIGEAAATVEARIEAGRSEREAADKDEFSRRVALLIDALNSTAIDVGKILSNDVPDSAWAAYLKGDRGVFTRRAVRLLDSNEARDIAHYYDSDPEFRGQVNRYVHDFEAMLRRVLADRDGSALGVTLLSSDMGKLYVALAQAIERLRN